MAFPAASRSRWQHLLLGVALLGIGALEGWYGRPELFGDDISYLDVMHSLQAGDWHAALNPLWSIGYPFLLTLLRPLFPSGIRGEMTAVFALNLVIFAAGWLALLSFLRSATAFLAARRNPGEASEPLPANLLTVAAFLYAAVQVSLCRVSSVGPDTLVCCVFFLACGHMLRFTLQPSARNGAWLGLLLGIGYLVKAIFLPLAVILIAVALLPLRRRLSPRTALSLPAGLMLLMLPYAAALSWAIGRPTLGESGSLNYAFHVNRLPHWMGWQGGPSPALRYPLHPVHLLRDNPAVFGFGEPFHVTYPPQFSMFYWYDGYRHFFSPANAIHAIVQNLHELNAILHEDLPLILGFLLAAILLRPPLVRRALQLYLPALLGVGLYLQVHLEPRYIAGFFAILAIAPFLDPNGPNRKQARPALLLAILGASLTLAQHLRDPFNRAIHHVDMQAGGQWALAGYLTQAGIAPNARVALVSTLNDIRCTWAYAAGLHIVASIGNDAYSPRNQQRDFTLFWTDPDIQADVLRLFRQQGAVAVIVPTGSPSSKPFNPAWQPIPNSQAWMLRLN